MVTHVRRLVQVCILLLVVWNVGCTCASFDIPETETTTTTGTTTEVEFPCGIDCSAIQTPPCTHAVCNTGQVIGSLYSCVVVQAPAGTGCDDGLFCTVDDACNDNGACAGGSENECGLASDPCVAVVCYEESESCDVSPVNDGTECTPTDLCKVNGICKLGACVGEPKDCMFSPLNECNKVSCEPATGKCLGAPDATKDDAPCVLTGDLCTTNRTCKAGQCGGGLPKDCSALNVGCQVGVCDSDTGICDPADAPIGTVCTEGLHECDSGACDDKGTCVATPAPNGIACNDHNSCTKTDKCTAGLCSGLPIGDCELYLNEGFEVCPGEWTFGGDWQCGMPENVGPTEAFTGKNVIATQIAGLYHVNQTFAMASASMPPIDLTTATNPVLSFWAWDHTEGNTYDGWNLKVSVNGGQNYSVITTVTPPYSQTILNQLSWGGNHSAEGWQHYSADLTPYVGKTALLRFSFRSDGAAVHPGVYIDDVVIAEPLQSPLFITTPSLPDIYADQKYSVQLTKDGGTSGSKWKITSHDNGGWLDLDEDTGLLGGTPLQANVGLVTVTIHVEELQLLSNFADRTYTFNVEKATYYTSFEGTCPNNWTLTGDWQCGVPESGIPPEEGPGAAFVGTQCIATKLAGPYSNEQTWAGTTATSPAISLTGLPSAHLTFRMWIDTEGATYDGANLEISTDDGMTYSLVDNVVPAYPLTVAGKLAWGGHQFALGWQPVQADLSAYIGQTIRLRFSFQSDNTGDSPGVYIDDFLVTE